MPPVSNPPDIQPSRHCHQPHTCEFWEHCTRNVPENWILELSCIKQDRFEALAAASGVATFDLLIYLGKHFFQVSY